jgi:hypothetical protein
MNILFQGKYSRTALKRYARDEQYKTTVMQVDQAALKFKDRIQLALPSELEIKYNPDNNTQALYLYLNNETLHWRENGYYHHYTRLGRGESIERWMVRTIDTAKIAYEQKLTECLSKNPLQEVTFQRVELVTEPERKRLSGQITPWANVSESLVNEFGTLAAEKIIEQLKAMGPDFEKALGSDLTLYVLSLIRTPGITVAVKKKNSDGTTSAYKPILGYDNSLISQQRVPVLPGFLSAIPITKRESSEAFFKSVLTYIQYLKKQAEDLTLYQTFLEECKMPHQAPNIHISAQNYLHWFGWDALKPTLTTLKEYGGFIKQLDPNVHLSYSYPNNTETISIAYTENGQVGSILGEMAPMQDDRFKVTRTKKQTPEQFMKAVFEKVKELLAERQRLDNLLKASKPDEAFSF